MEPGATNKTEKVITVTNPTIIARIKKILANKVFLHKKIREGKISEIKSEVHFRESL